MAHSGAVPPPTAHASNPEFRKEGTHILVTQGPPFGTLDRPRGTDRCDGCRKLLAAVTRIQPRLHIFLHIHGGYCTHRANGTIVANAAHCGESQGIEQQAIVADLEPGK
ncbi:MAG: hypothetical protein ABSH24_35455 [Bryobacteraceae bacterium]